MNAPAHPIVLFDGVCHFCTASVQFIIKRDPSGQFQFASQQSNAGRALLAKAGLPETMDTFVLVESDHTYTRSTAALKVAAKLSGAWWLCGIFWIVPRFVRDACYSVVARNRYRWFGKHESCWVPTPEIRARFLD